MCFVWGAVFPPLGRITDLCGSSLWSGKRTDTVSAALPLFGIVTCGPGMLTGLVLCYLKYLSGILHRSFLFADSMFTDRVTDRIFLDKESSK